MPRYEFVDVTDEAQLARVPPCADPAFDHRTCDYWEDPDRGSKVHRPGWLKQGAEGEHGLTRGASAGSNPFAPPPPGANPFAPPPPPGANPFAPPPRPANPFAPLSSGPARNPFLEDLDEPVSDNPFAPKRPPRPNVGQDAPRKLQLLGRGLGVFGSYAKLLLVDGESVAYCQFGPLSAYPRALRLRELYPQLPAAPLPAVISCIATSATVRRHGHATRLVEEVCRDLASRGFSAVEAYPEARAQEDATPAAHPAFWLDAGFELAVDDERFPVMRRGL